MEDIRDLIINLAKNNEVISDEKILYQIIDKLLNKYALIQYIKRIKTDWIPIVPGSIVEYDYKKSRFHYYTWSIEKLVEELSLYEFKDQYAKNLFISLMILKYIEREMEFIRQLNIKSNNTDTFENKLLYLSFKEFKKSDDDTQNYLYRKNAMLAHL